MPEPRASLLGHRNAYVDEAEAGGATPPAASSSAVPGRQQLAARCFPACESLAFESPPPALPPRCAGLCGATATTLEGAEPPQASVTSASPASYAPQVLCIEGRHHDLTDPFAKLPTLLGSSGPLAGSSTRTSSGCFADVDIATPISRGRLPAAGLPDDVHLDGLLRFGGNPFAEPGSARHSFGLHQGTMPLAAYG